MARILPSKKPFARGVTQLMYVGDAEPRTFNLNMWLGAGLLAYAAIGRPSKRAQLASALGGAGLLIDGWRRP